MGATPSHQIKFELLHLFSLALCMAALAYFFVFLSLAVLTTKLFAIIYGAVTPRIGACGIFFILLIIGCRSHNNSPTKKFLNVNSMSYN